MMVILLWLASSDFTRSEVNEFGKWVEERGSRELAERIVRLREIAHAVVDAETEGRPKYRGASQEKVPRTTASGVAKQIESMLVREAGLTRADAARMLRGELEEMGPFVQLPTYRNGSLAEYVRKLENHTNASTLLHVATKIRNMKIHPTATDWPLKR